MAIHIPHAPLKGVFFGHLILTVWAGQSGLLPSTYLFYNGIFLLTILWSLHHRDSEEGPFMAVCINVTSVFLDIVTMVIWWPTIWTNQRKFSAVSVLLNLVLRPISSFLLYRIVQDRAGTYGNFVLPSGLNGIFGSTRRSPYEDLDQPNQQMPPTSDMTGINHPGNHSPDSIFTT